MKLCKSYYIIRRSKCQQNVQILRRCGILKRLCVKEKRMDKIKKYFSRLNIRSYIWRVITGQIALIIADFGLGAYYASGLGSDPSSVFNDGMHNILGCTYGEANTIWSWIFFAGIVLFMRDQLGIGALLDTVTAGPFIDLFEQMLSRLYPSTSSPMYVRLLLVAVGCICFAGGTGIFIGTNIGIGPYNFPTMVFSRLLKKDVNVGQLIADAIFFAVGWALGGVIGIGTVVGVLLQGFILDYAMKKSEPIVDRIFGQLYKD